MMPISNYYKFKSSSGQIETAKKVNAVLFSSHDHIKIAAEVQKFAEKKCCN